MVVFEYRFNVGTGDIDELGHTNNLAYLPYLQLAAGEHWDSVISESDVFDKNELAWVVRKHVVEYLRPSFLDETLVVKTWLEKPTSPTWDRAFEVRSEECEGIVIRAKTTYVLIRKKTGRPIRIPSEISDRFPCLPQ